MSGLDPAYTAVNDNFVTGFTGSQFGPCMQKWKVINHREQLTISFSSLSKPDCSNRFAEQCL